MKLIILILLITVCYAKHYFRAIWDCDDEECVIDTCDPGFADCNRNSIDGCEVNIDNEIYNCGQCGVSCPMLPNGIPNCVSGKCTVGLCDPPYGNCGSHGCEVDLSTDINNCGYCGNICPVPTNAISSCTAGKCGFAACTAGYADCDRNLANGCEANLQTDPNNCGICGVKCTTSCIAGACPSGTANYANYGCVCLGNTQLCSSSMPLSQIPSTSFTNPYSPLFTTDTCFTKCYGVLGDTMTFFTLAMDTSSQGMNTLCQCYNATLTNPTVVSKCLNGHGMTFDGEGSVELYTPS